MKFNLIFKIPIIRLSNFLKDSYKISVLLKTTFTLILIPFYANAQEYINLVKIGYGQSFNNEFKDINSSTQINFFDSDINFPIPINEKHVLVTGFSFSVNNLQLYPEADFTSLYSSTLKLGIASKFSEKWSTTIVFLPKMASDYENLSSDDFYYGGFAVLKLQKKENLIYRFGFYASSEAYGFYGTPIIGWYYNSPNKRFEMDVSLPLVANINYRIGSATIGFDYIGIGRTFNLTKYNVSQRYVDMSSLEFSNYLQFNVLQNSVLLRAKFGYATSGYDVYTNGENIDFGLTGLKFGDDREQLNPEIEGSLFLKFELIYRFKI